LRKAAIAAVAILIVGGAAMLAIAFAPTVGMGPRPEVSAAAPDAPTASHPIPAALPPLPGSQPGWGLSPVEPAPPPTYEPPPPKPPPESWEAAPIAARMSALGPIGAAVSGELADLQPRLSECFDETTQSRYGQIAFSRTQDFTPSGGAGTTILVLQLEMSAGQVRIVDAPVESQGGAPDGLVACAQEVLRGQVIRAPGAKPGQRARLMFPLFQ
jgi:hypothetical protein